MGFFSRLFGKKKGKIDLSDEDLIDAGACPNCWGKQEYDNEYIEYFEDKTKANINKDRKNQKAFVQQFVETNITGIRLKKDGDFLSCSKCTKKFKYVSSKAN